jgi:hypothetical protein
VITGYNTDVKHGSRVFHIQTEDKGATNPFIESHVYVGGEIIGTRRTPYADLLQKGQDDQALQERMEQQHRTMIAAIQKGKFDGPNGSLRVPEGMSGKEAAGERPPPPTPPTVAAQAPGDRTLDQVILEYLASELTQEQVDVTLSPAPNLHAGDAVTLTLKAESSLSHQPIAGATVQVRILSTFAKPAVVFQGKTAADGSCAVRFAVPAFSDGNAAAVLRVSSSAGSTELKYSVKRKA